MKTFLRKLIDDGVLDYDALVLRYYHKFGLSEKEAVALIKLNSLLEERKRIIKAEKFAKMLSLSARQTEELLNGLMNKGYLAITLVKREDGREMETFNVDYILAKVANHLKKKLEKEDENVMGRIVSHLEEVLEKPLSSIDFELVKQWVHEEGYSEKMIREAASTALAQKRPSVKSIDRILLSAIKDLPTERPKKNKEALKDFHKLWEE